MSLMRGGRSRSPSMASNMGVSPSRAGSSKLGTALTKAQRETDRELQRHLQSLLHMKNRVRRLHDDISKEYSGLFHALRESNELYTELIKESEACATTRSATGATIQGAPGDSLDTVVQRHLRMVDDAIRSLVQLIEDGKNTMNELTLQDRESQHLMVLVDRATDVDMQCLGDAGTVGDSVITNGSPLYPGITINDGDRIIAKGAALCSKTSRLATAIRRHCSNVKADASHSAHQLEVACGTSARVNAETLSVASRQLEGLDWTEGRLRKQQAQLQSELDAVEERCAHVKKTLALRSTAKDAILSLNGQDAVANVLKKEQKELDQRREELHHKLAKVAQGIDNVEAERAEHRANIERARMQDEIGRNATTAVLNRGGSAPSHHNQHQPSVSRSSMPASHNQSPVRGRATNQSQRSAHYEQFAPSQRTPRFSRR